jgi:hypothetical protein
MLDLVSGVTACFRPLSLRLGGVVPLTRCVNIDAFDRIGLPKNASVLWVVSRDMKIASWIVHGEVA